MHAQVPRGPFEPRRAGNNLFLHGEPALLLFRIRQRVAELLGFVAKSQSCEVLDARVNEPSRKNQRRNQQQRQTLQRITIPLSDDSRIPMFRRNSPHDVVSRLKFPRLEFPRLESSRLDSSRLESSRLESRL